MFEGVPHTLWLVQLISILAVISSFDYSDYHGIANIV